MEEKETKQKTKNEAVVKQWNNLKEKHPDSMLLFRQNDLYKIYNEDAERAGKVLRIAVNPPHPDVAGEKGFDKVAAFPYYSLDSYLPKLIRSGERVAICDKLEPKINREQTRNSIHHITEKDRTLVENALDKTFTREGDTWIPNKIENNMVHGIMNGGEHKIGIGEAVDMLNTGGWKEKEQVVAAKADTTNSHENKREEVAVETGRKSYSRKDGKQSAEDKALDRFADMMIEKIKGIKEDWFKPWFTEGTMAWPKNLDGRDYNGMNALMLMMHQEKEGYKLPVYATFASLQRLNSLAAEKAQKNGEEAPVVMVNKGEKSFPVFLTTFTVVDKETGDKIPFDDYKRLSKEEQEKFNVYPRLHVFNVFNVGQTDMQEVRPELWQKLEEKNMVKKPELKGDEFVFEPVDKMIKDNQWICPIKPTKGDNAYYSLSKDEIIVPLKEQFRDGESFYSNLFHEMAHSTGREDILKRELGGGMGSDKYAREELVAELTAALTASRYGMTKNIKSDSAAYLKSWLSSLNESPDFIKTTLMDVKKSSAFISSKIDGVAEELQKVKEPEKARDVITNITTAAQYEDFKKQYPNTMLMMNNRDLTVTLLDKDAEKASKILNVPLLSGQEAEWRGGKKAVEFNVEALPTFVEKIQKAGERVNVQDTWTEKVMEERMNRREEKTSKNNNVELNTSTAMKKSTDNLEKKQSSEEEKAVKAKTPRKTKQASAENKGEEVTEQKGRKSSSKKTSSKEDKSAEVKTPKKEETKNKREEKSEKLEKPKSEVKNDSKTETKTETKATTKNESQKEERKEQTKVEGTSSKQDIQDKSKEVKEEKGEKQKREPQLVTVNGDKVSHAHAFQHNTQPDLWLFTAKLNEKQLHPMVMSKEDVAAYQAKETTVKDLMEKYYPSKMQQRLTPEEFKAGKELSNGQIIDTFRIFKENKQENADYGKWKGYAEVDGKKMVATLSSGDLNAYFDRTKTPAKIVENTFGEKLHLASAYEKYKLPEGLEDKNVRIAKSKDGKWNVSVDMGEYGITSKKPISFDDGQSYFKAKTATKGQIAAKYLSTEMSEMRGQSQKQEQSRGRGI